MPRGAPSRTYLATLEVVRVRHAGGRGGRLVRFGFRFDDDSFRIRLERHDFPCFEQHIHPKGKPDHGEHDEQCRDDPERTEPPTDEYEPDNASIFVCHSSYVDTLHKIIKLCAKGTQSELEGSVTECTLTTAGTLSLKSTTLSLCNVELMVESGFRPIRQPYARVGRIVTQTETGPLPRKVVRRTLAASAPEH